MTAHGFDNIHLVTCVGVDTELGHLPHFIDHYCALGIQPDNFHVVLNTSDKNSPGLDAAKHVLTQRGLKAQETWVAPYTSDAMWAKRREVQARVTNVDDWVVSADVDEFHEYPAPLPEVIAECERRGARCVQGVFIDRLAPGGKLAAVAEQPSIQEQFPIQADVQCAIAGTGEHYNYRGTVKMMVFKGTIWPDRGGHMALRGDSPVEYLFSRDLGLFPAIGNARFRFFVPLRVHHFKWTDTMPATLRRRLATPGVSVAGGEYTRALLDYFDQYAGVVPDDVPRRSNTAATTGTWRARITSLRVLDAALWYRTRLTRIGSKVLSRGT